MDIRRYFGGDPSKSKPPTTTSNVKKDGSRVQTTSGHEKNRLSRKRPSVVIASDSDEEPIPKRSVTKKESKRSSVIIDDSDDDVPPTPPTKPKPAVKTKVVKLEKPTTKVSPSDFFGKGPAHRANRLSAQSSKTSKISSNKEALPKKVASRNDEFEIHDDDDFVETLKALEDIAPSKVQNEPPSKTTSKSNGSREDNRKSISADKKTVSVSSPDRPPGASKTSKVAAKRSSSLLGTPKAVKKTGGNTAAYLSYLNREGPTAPGSKEIPQGEEGCFDGLTFVVTGVMESLERTEMEDLVKKYGGKVTSSLSSKTSYIVVGRDAGVSKLSKADSLKTKRLTEDGLLDLISTRHGKSLAANVPSPATTPKSSSAKSSKKSLYFTNTSGSSVKKELGGADQNSSSPSTTPVEKQHHVSPTVMVKTEMSSSRSPAPSASPSNPRLLGSPQADNGPGHSLLWVDKYKPISTKQIIGQQGDASNVAKLRSWLDQWHANHSGTSTVKAKKTGWFGAQSSSLFKAALLSGPPGVGKTTTAQLVCKESGFTFVELNASDTRSKKCLQEIVAQMVRNTSLSQYIEGNVKGAQNHCLLMDEVDGISGTEDRGGMLELIQLIKISKIPIICMCNDRNHLKIRSLANHCYDLRFARPGIPQLKAAMLSVCFKEKLNISAQAIEEIALGAGQDVRQVLHNMSMWSVINKSLTVEEATAEAKNSKKDTKKNIFDVTRLVFSASDHKTMSINDRSDLFFTDYQMAPLFVQEGYLRSKPEHVPLNSSKHVHLVSQAADSICDGDLVEKLLRSEQQWGLLPLQAMFSSVVPGYLLEGDIGYPSFPSWFGRNSTAKKNERLIQEVHFHASLKVSCNKNDLNCDYLPLLCKAIVNPLISREVEGVPLALRMMNEYCLAREDMDSVVALTLWPEQQNPLSRISSQVKGAFTRAYNKDPHRNPYSTSMTVAKKSGKAGAGDTQEYIEDDEYDNAGGEEEETEDVTKDAMIKVKKTVAPKSRAKKTSEPSTSKKGASSRRKK